MGQDYVSHKMQESGVCNKQSAGVRHTLNAECRDQQYNTNRMQVSAVHQRSGVVTCRKEGTGAEVYNEQSAGIMFALKQSLFAPS